MATEFSDNCIASLPNRFLLLSSQESRNSALNQIKHLLKSIDVELSNKIISLIYEIYLDAQYKERTNLQMKQIIVGLQSQLQAASSPNIEPEPISSRIKAQKEEIIKEKRSAMFSNLEKRLMESYDQIDRLTKALENIEKQNNQLKNELANSCIDQQTEILIEQLTIQLEHEKNKNKQLMGRCEMLEEELNSLETVLVDRNKLVKLTNLP